MRRLLAWIFVLLSATGSVFAFYTLADGTACESKLVEEFYVEESEQLQERVSCSDEPTNVTCANQLVVVKVYEKKSRLVEVCGTEIGVNVTIAGVNRIISDDRFGCFVSDGKMTCYDVKDGYHPDRAEKYWHECDGESCITYKLDDGEVLNMRYDGDEFQV